MKCVMCPCTDISLLKLQTYIDYKTLNEITFVVPDFAIPETRGPVYVCASCQEQVSTLYIIKKTSLKNLRHLNLYKDILRKTSDVKFNELKIVSTNIKHEFKINSNCDKILPSEAENEFTEKVSNSPNDDESKFQHASKQMRFKCCDCKKTFAYQSELERHTRVHSGERPYKCPSCPKTFTRSTHLTTHKLSHTGNPYTCDICDKTFGHKSNLIIHNRSHTNELPYKCSVCQKAFTHSGNLSRHMSTHKEEKPHQCHACSYKCKQAADLKRHMRSHTGEKPFICKFCQKSFTRCNRLREHERRIHNDEHII